MIQKRFLCDYYYNDSDVKPMCLDDDTERGTVDQELKL